MLIEPTIKQVNNWKFIDGVMIDEFIKNNEVPAIIFNGPGKTNKMLELAIIEGVELINVDSESERRVINLKVSTFSIFYRIYFFTLHDKNRNLKINILLTFRPK